MAPPKGHKPYNVFGEGGRPKEWTLDKIDALADNLHEWLVEAHKDKKSFWWHDWCWENGIRPTKVVQFVKESERFREVYEHVKEWQESIVVKGALTKKLSDGFSKFYLCNHYSKNWAESKVAENVAEEINKNYEAILAQLKESQSSTDLNICATNSKEDHKS
jgi:hypothetical protein